MCILAYVYNYGCIDRVVCPPVDPNSAGTCVDECTNDSNCTNQLCCSNGCGNVCMDPLNCSVSYINYYNEICLLITYA